MRMRFLLLFGIACKSSGTVLEIPDDPDPDPSTVPLPTPPLPTPPAEGCADVFAQPEGAFLERDVTVHAVLPECTTASHAFAGAAGTNVAITWQGPPATLTLTDLLDTPLHSQTVATGDALTWTLEWTGEHLIQVQLDDDVGGLYALSTTCTTGCEVAYTRYPLFFMHGMAGTESFLDGLEYWYGVRELLEPLGYVVHTESVDPFQSSIVRGGQWIDHLDALVATGTVRRFNLIAHSQGGIDARWVTSVLDTDGRIQSVTTIATPHRGTIAGEMLSGVLTDTLITGPLLDAMFDGIGQLYGTSSDQDILAQLDTLGVNTMSDFNADVPDRPDVRYFSWSGRTCQLLDLFCQNDNGGEIVTPLFAATHLGMQIFEGDNDGLVSEQSAMWGTYLGQISADHLDEVGLLPGTTAPGFDHLEFYLGEAERLRGLGL